MNRLIIFLIRKKLGLKKGERFQFVNQKSPNDEYFFDSKSLVKVWVRPGYGFKYTPSNVSLNWLLNDNCQIKKMENLNYC